MEKRLKEVLDNKEGKYILPFYWQHGESRELLEEGMEKIHASAIDAVCVESRPHPDFLGESWWRDLDIILNKAKELNMHVWVLDDAHFPSGYCNGQVTEDSPYGKTYLTHYTIDVLGPVKENAFMVKLEAGESLVGVTLSRRHREESFHQTQVQDVTSRVRDGKLYVDIPAGVWAITVIKTTKKGTGRKGYINPIDAGAVKFFLDTVYEAHYTRYAKEFGKTFAGFFSDEPEIGNCLGEYIHDSYLGQPTMSLPWGDELERELKAIWGDSFVENLLAMWVNVDEYAFGLERKESFGKGFSDNRPEWGHVPKGWTEMTQLNKRGAVKKTGLLRREFMGLVSMLYGKNFCTQIGDWCRAHQVEYIGHVIEDGGTHSHLGLGTGHFFKALWGQDMSGIDVVLQQIRPQMDDFAFCSIGGKGFYHGEFFHYGLAKLGSSLAHLDEKKHGRTMCEVFGAYGWAEGLKLMKWIMDHMLVRGVNYFVPHAFTMKDFPDPDCPPHFYARGKNPQYPFFRYLMEYTNRVSHLINGGLHKPVVALLYTAEQEWMGPVRKFEKDARELMRGQIDFEVVSEEILLQANVINGRLILGEEEIRAVVVPGSEYITLELAEKCANMVQSGIPVFLTENMPVILKKDGVACQAVEVHSGEPGQGTIGSLVRGDALADELRCNHLFDIKTSENQPWLRYYRYAHSAGEFYLFFNESVTEDIHTGIVFEESPDKISEKYWWYDPWTNQLSTCNWGLDGRLELALSTYEMKILYVGDIAEEFLPEVGVHRNGIAEYEALSCEGTCEQVLCDNEWQVELCSYERLSEKCTEKQEESAPWEKIPEGPGNLSAYDKYPNFSGQMRYRTTFTWTGEREGAILDLGEVYETAQVFLNGQEIGVRLAPPYRFDITKALRSGENRLEILVANTLVHAVRDYFSMTLPMEPSGLMGPVRILS